MEILAGQFPPPTLLDPNILPGNLFPNTLCLGSFYILLSGHKQNNMQHYSSAYSNVMFQFPAAGNRYPVSTMLQCRRPDAELMLTLTVRRERCKGRSRGLAQVDAMLCLLPCVITRWCCCCSWWRLSILWACISVHCLLCW
jgi:hypothetical protein